MTSKQLRQLWFAVGTVLFYLSFNFCSWSQRWIIAFPVPNFTNTNPDVANYLGVLICAPILFVELLITQQYMRSSQSSGWASRIPTFFDPAPAFAATHTKILQATLYGGVLAFAEIAQFHFFEKFIMRSEVTYHGHVVSRGLSKFTEFVSPWHALDNGYKLLGCTYYPFWEPWALVAGELFLLWVFTKTTLDIFLPQRVKMAHLAETAQKAGETSAIKMTRSVPLVPAKSLEVFCSYSHKDEKFLKQLVAHFSVLLKEGLISS